MTCMTVSANNTTPPLLFHHPAEGRGLVARSAFINSGYAAPDAALRRHGDLDITICDFKMGHYSANNQSSLVEIK